MLLGFVALACFARAGENVALNLVEWFTPEEEIRVTGRLPEGVTCDVQRQDADGHATYAFTLKNVGTKPVCVDERAFGVVVPIDGVLAGRKHDAARAAIWHVWCGGEVTWLYACHTHGKGPVLSMNLLKGSVGSYSLLSDATVAPTGAHSRGWPVLHATRRMLAPGEGMELVFRLEVTEKRPDCEVFDVPDAAVVQVQPCSAWVGGSVNVQVRTSRGVTNRVVKLETPGEKIIPIEIPPGRDGAPSPSAARKTFVRVNALRPLREILETRARFTIERQQCDRPGDPTDGAYVIYDRATGRQVCSPGEDDHNAARERLGMGCVVAQAARVTGDPKLRASLERHRAFVLREIFDAGTGEVFNGVGRGNRHERRYNYPWMAAYWIEWHKLTGESLYLDYAVRIVDRYYAKLNGAAQESHGTFLPELANLLEKAGKDADAKRMREHLLAQADNILSRAGRSVSGEVALTGAMPAMRITFLAQAYLQTGARKYLDAALADVPQMRAYLARQPDYRTGMQNPRWWDGFWFGKSRLYGDTMPQWCGAAVGEACHWLARADGREADRLDARENLMGQLSAFFPDGFASCAGFAFATATYTKESGAYGPFMKPGTYAGAYWDDWANDQDWSLYYAMKYLWTED